MILKRMLFFIVILCTVHTMSMAYAEETDQFTLPSHALQDIGPIASHNLYEVLKKIVAQTNSEMQILKIQAKHSRYASRQLALRKQDSYLADLIYKNTGPGIPKWLRLYDIPKQSKPISYKEKLPWNTVYWLVFSPSPLFVVGLAPTINMYGYHFGTDKLGHFFMMGHTYYKIYNYLLTQGKSIEFAHAALVTYGQILEQTYLGTLINGVYSNADLAANYAGWKFYMNIAHSVTVGDQMLPPILIMTGNKWIFSRHIDENTLLKAYLSDNLNEAWNPCHYTFTRNQVRKQILKRCDNWIVHKHITQQSLKDKYNETRTWHGEDYGHWLPKSHAITLEACFG